MFLIEASPDSCFQLIGGNSRSPSRFPHQIPDAFLSGRILRGGNLTAIVVLLHGGFANQLKVREAKNNGPADKVHACKLETLRE